MPPEQSDFLCGNWVWDPVLRELRNYRRRRKGWEDEPDAVERLQPARSVRLHRWSQAPMQTQTGELMPASLARIVVEYEAGGNLTLTEYDRACAEKLAHAIAQPYGLTVVEAGAPGGRRRGNLPPRDGMGRLVSRTDGTEVVLDEVGGELQVTQRRRLFRKSRRRIPTAEIRRLELGYEVSGPTETFTVWAVTGPEEEKLPLAVYRGYEGWAEPEEWREFTQELGRSLGVEVRP